MSESIDPTDLAPWAHPKAQRWLQSMFEENTFSLSLEDELIKAETQRDFNKIRMILALGIIFGQDDSWPQHRLPILRSIARTAGKITKTDVTENKGPLTIAQHQGRTTDDESLQHELEIFRRRLNLSNRKGELKPPKWGRIWE